MSDRVALIKKLDDALEAVRQVGINAIYDLDSPEVQAVPMFSLRLNIGEARLIRDVLSAYEHQRNLAARSDSPLRGI